MKKTLLLNAFVVLLLALTVQAMGQYTGSYPNVAISKLVVATDSMDAHKPRLAVDDDLLTYASIPGAAPGWLMINLGGYYYVDGFGFVLPNGGELVNDFIFQVSEDGDAWTDVTTETIAGTGTYNYTIAETDPVGFVRIYMTDKDANASFSEVYVYGSELPVPAAPNALAATNITASSFRANWASVALADGYVYTVAYDAAFTQYVPGYEGIWVGAATNATVTGLAPGTTYHFKARAFNLSGSSNWGLRQTATTLQGTQTITFGALDAVDYGDAAFDLTATASSGLAVSYTSSDVSVATVSGSTVTIVGPGTTDITASQGGNAQYTAAVPVVQDLVVNRAPLGVALAVAEDKVYDGNTDAVIVGATLDGLVGDDDVTLTGATSGVFAQTGVGTDIVVTVSMDIAGGDVAKYIFTAPGGFVADIQPKELIVTAEDKSREECAANPSLTFTYDGFVGDEDESALTTEPVPATTATDGSADGDYDITLSGGVADNYSFTYVSGTLTVTPDVTMPVLITRNATVLLDANDMGSLVPDSVVSQATDNCAVSDTVLSQNTFTIADVGTVTINVMLTDASGNTTTETALVVVQRTTGIPGATEKTLKFYPNPTRGVVHLGMQQAADELMVMDMTGKIILRKGTVEKDEAIDLSGFHNGIYVFQLRFGDETQRFKVVKN